jgi:organic radical activating enzyme
MIKYQHVTISDDKWELDTKSTNEKSLQLFISNKCNLNCENCFSKNLTDEQKKDMKLEDIVALVKQNPGFRRVNLMGGEPLIHKNINEIITNIKKINGRRISIFTNALMLNRLKSKCEPVRLAVSFHELQHSVPSRKPLIPVLNILNEYHNRGSEVVLIFLIDSYNCNKVKDVVNYIDKNVLWIKTLRIGLMRNEDDYWNDNSPGVISFEKYKDIIQNLVNTYEGRLSFEILTKGVLIFNNNKQDGCSVDRFRNVYTDLTYTDCVMGVSSNLHKPVSEDKKFLPSHKTCNLTNKPHCLIYKVRLKNKFHTLNK